MNKTPGKKQLTHERIVAVAARALRRGGFDGVGVADIMKEAGLTHGGFYAHFASREALMCEALTKAGQDSADHLNARGAVRKARGASPFRGLVEQYLSHGHLLACEEGCPLAALLSEVPRQTSTVARTAARRVRGLIETVQKTLPAGTQADIAAVIASQMVGALQFARALGDNAEGRAVLTATRRQLLDAYDSPDRALRHNENA